MKNTIADLNNYLFEELERINDDGLTQEQLEVEMKKSQAIVNVSNAIINNAKVGLDATRMMCEYGRNESATAYLPKLLGNGKN